MALQNIKVTVDAVIFREKAPGSSVEVLLIRRKNSPFKGQYAFPGGFLEKDEDLKAAAERELEEETKLKGISLLQLGAFGKPGRDPRGPTVTVAFWGWCRNNCHAEGSSDAVEASWFPVKELPELAFDHREILDSALERMMK